jgi:hypothetical protein
MATASHQDYKPRGTTKMTDHEIIQNLHRRMDKQDDMLLSIHDTITKHVAEEEQLRPHLEEVVLLWRGSRLMVSIIGGVAFLVGIAYTAFSWAKGYIK